MPAKHLILLIICCCSIQRKAPFVQLRQMRSLALRRHFIGFKSNSWTQLAHFLVFGQWKVRMEETEKVAFPTKISGDVCATETDTHPSDLSTTIVDAICLSSVHKSRLRNFEYCKLYHSLTSPHLEEAFMVTLRTAKNTKLLKLGGERLLGKLW